MGYTADELQTMLTETKTAISKCLTAQEYSAGAGLSVRRAYLKDLMDREKWLISQISAVSGSVGSGFDPSSKVEIVEPT
jgi:hypothetical protein